MSRPTLRIYLLGRFAVEYRGRRIPQELWKRRRPVELLSALALAPGHGLHREELIDRLWPDKDLEAGANNLYRTLHDLRRATGSDAVNVDRGVVRLAEGTWTDVEAFEAAVAVGDEASLESALELYRGPLLCDDPYSEAFAARREGLRQRFVDAALRLARRLEDADGERRIGVLRTLLEVDPTLEEAHRMLMAALAGAGRTRDAIRQFAACTRVLREKLDVTPSADTLDLHRRIKEGDVPAEAVAPGDAAAASGPGASAAVAPKLGWAHVARRLIGSEKPAPMRGRARALAEVEAFVRDGRGALLVLGEGGVGKTRLACEGARRAAEAGAAVLAGLGYDFTGTAPYTPFVDAWTDYLRHVGRPDSDNPFLAFSPTPGASAQEDRLRLFQSVERALADLGGESGTCVVLEDLHEADESTLFLFHHLARASRHLPLMLVATLRAEEVRIGNPLHTLLTGLGRERLARRVELDRLDQEATAELARDLWPAVSARAVEAVYRLAEGNPYYTEEVVRSMRELGSGEPALTDDLRDAVRQRVIRLGPEAERLFVAASVIDRRFDFEVARRAGGLDAHAALQALERGLSARIVEEHDDRYRFRHALTREALYGALTHARRVYLHRAVAAALEEMLGAASEEVAELLSYHYQAAGELERAVPHLLSAADRARSRLGFNEAIGFFEKAIELIDILGRPPDQERFEVLRTMGAMRVALGDLERAVRDLEAAGALRGAEGWQPEPFERAQVLRLAGLALIEAGDLSAAEQRLDQAMELVEGGGGELANVLYLYSTLRWHQSRHQEAYALAERCLAEAERQADREAIARGYEMLALACHSLGEWRKGVEYVERRRDLADGTLDVASAFDVHL